MKRELRPAAKAVSAFGAVVIAYLLLLARPEPLFSHSVTYSGIAFHSTYPLPPQAQAIASAVAARLSTSEIYEAQGGLQRVFVVQRSWLWSLLNGPYRRALARNVELGNAILVPQLDAAKGVICHFDGRCAGAVNILTHEAVHTLVQRRIGVIRVWRLAWWKREGYPEYVASERCKNSEAPAHYQEAARTWKDLLETHRYSFDEVLLLRTPNGA